MSKEPTVEQQVTGLVQNINNRVGILNTAVTDLLNDVRQVVSLLIAENSKLKGELEDIKKVKKDSKKET